MKNTNVKYKFYLLAALVASIALAAFRVVLLLFFFDKDVNYFARGTALPTVWSVLLLLAALFAASSVFVIKENELKEKKFSRSGFSVFASALCAFSLILNSVFGLTKGEKGVLNMIAAISAIPAALYFLSILATGSVSKLRSLFGFFVPIWGVLNLASIYFDSYVAINDPNEIIEQTAFISVMLFFLYELRVHLEKQKPKLHLFFGMCALIFTATASFPGIIAVSLGKTDAKYLVYDVIFAAMFLYICREMFTSEKDE